MFDEEESKLILGLPVSLVGCGDRVIWHYAKNGEYTVRTGYGVAMEMQENGEFVVRVNLIRRRMQVDGRCMMCGEAEEKDHHLFFDCKMSYCRKVFILCGESGSAAMTWSLKKAVTGGAAAGGNTSFASQQVLRDFARLLQAVDGEGGLIFNTPVMAEAVAIRAALQVCIELGCTEVEVESDSRR
ncbi:hypothetical protein ACFX2I_011887 [Malus domestica]